MAISETISTFTQDFTNFIFHTTGYHSTIWGILGTMIADSARTRIDVVHAGSKKINTSPGMTGIIVTAEEAAHNPNIKEGVNQAILIESRKVGTYALPAKSKSSTRW